MTAFPAKNIEIAGNADRASAALGLAAPSRSCLCACVGTADRQPHPHPARNRDHRRANVSTTAAAQAGDTEAGIRTRALPANSISIAGIAGGAVTPSPAGATST